MSLFSFFKNPSEETVIIFDVGSASVGGAIVELEYGKKPSVSFTKRLEIPMIESSDLAGKRTAILNCFDSVSQSLAKEGLKRVGIKRRKIRTAFVCLSFPWAHSGTKEVRVENVEPKEVSREFVSEVLKTEGENLKSFILSEKDTDRLHKENSIIDKKVSRIKLNGYKVPNPYSQKARVIEMSVFASVASSAFLGLLERSVMKSWGIGSVIFHSSLFSFFESLKYTFVRNKDFLIIDATGDATQISLIKDGAVERTVSMIFGRNNLINKISSKFGSSKSISASFLKLYNEKRGEKRFAEEVSKLIDNTRDEWKENLKQNIKSLASSEQALPKNIFVFTPLDFSEILGDFLKESFGSNHQVIVVDEDKISHFVLFKEGVGKDTFLSVESVFLNGVMHL